MADPHGFLIATGWSSVSASMAARHWRSLEKPGFPRALFKNDILPPFGAQSASQGRISRLPIYYMGVS
jgi:hypothetical protein